MPLPDTATSRAVIVGVSDYTELEALPAVANNVTDMGALFLRDDLWGLPKEHCATLLNPATGREVLEAVYDAAAETRDTFVLYFAGHGLVAPHSDELCLALPDTNRDRLYRALEFSKLRRVMLEAGGGARNKVVIVDCCFSGLALEGHMGPAVQMADHTEVDGSYVMTASAENRLSLAPPGERFTAFTGELVRVLSEGIPHGPEFLDMETIYRSVLGELRAKGRPIPQQRIRNGGRSITLVRNRQGVADRLDFLQVGQAQTWREQGRDADAVRACEEWSSLGNTRHPLGRRMAHVQAVSHEASGGSGTVPWRALSVAVASVVGVGLGLALLLVPEGSESPAGHGASPTSSSASPSRTAPPGRPAADDVADIGSQPVNTAAIMGLRACTAADITVRLTSVFNSYLDEDPHLKLSVRADTGGGGPLPCRINLSRSDAYLMVTRAGDPVEVWKSSACASGHSAQRWVQLARDKPVTVDFHWDRRPNSKGCDQAGPASAGVYLAEALVLNEKAQTSFVLLQGEATTPSETPSPIRSAATATATATASSGSGGGTSSGGTSSGGAHDEKSATPSQSNIFDQPAETTEPTDTTSRGGNGGGIFGGPDGG